MKPAEAKTEFSNTLSFDGPWVPSAAKNVLVVSADDQTSLAKLRSAEYAHKYTIQIVGSNFGFVVSNQDHSILGTPTGDGAIGSGCVEKVTLQIWEKCLCAENEKP